MVYRATINSMRSPTANVRKGELIATVRFKYILSTNVYIYMCIYICVDTSLDHFTPARAARAGSLL